MLPKDGMRPQLIPEHEIECLSSPQAELLYEHMKEDQTIDPVKLDLCEYQAIEPVHPYHLVVISDTSKIDAIESLPDPEPQQDTIAADQTPHPISEPHAKKGPNTYWSR